MKADTSWRPHASEKNTLACHSSQRYALTYGDLEEESVLALTILTASIQRLNWYMFMSTWINVYTKIMVTVWLTKPLSSWLSVPFRKSKQWNVEIADKLRNKWATAASGHKKRLISCPWVCCWCTASAQHSSRLKCEKQCRQVCVWSNWMTFTQVPLRLRGKEP